MSRPYIPKALRQKVAAKAKHRCGYCLTPQSFTAMPMHVEHIIPFAAGGPSTEDNLWLACPLCNGYKRDQTYAIDAVTGEQISLFNPRQQVWFEHFRWNEDGTEIIALTACGQATIITLKLNNKYLIRARQRWLMARPQQDSRLPLPGLKFRVVFGVRFAPYPQLGAGHILSRMGVADSRREGIIGRSLASTTRASSGALVRSFFNCLTVIS